MNYGKRTFYSKKFVGNNVKTKWLLLAANIIYCLIFSLTITGCPDQLALQNNELPINEEMALVRIYIGENSSIARTVQPSRGAIAGYQLTFSGPSTQTPVNITEGNSIDMLLANGTWIITAKAYRLNGVIGNSNDEIASGSITISISSGIIFGTVPPIILTSSGTTGSGVMSYNITVNSGISGYMKLYGIDGITPVNAFGINGVLNLFGSVASNFTHTAGRYIAEVRLENQEGKVAFHREVIDIWRGTTTAFVFIPTVFFDPSHIAANYGDFNVASNNPSMIFNTEGILTITGDGNYTISMREGLNSTSTERIVISSGVTANITLSDVNIDRGNSNSIAFNMTDANVNLTLVGNNILRSGGGAGLHSPEGSMLNIIEASTGSLTATATWWPSGGAGIGGSSNVSGGSISINGGTVTATGTGTGNTAGISGTINSINGNAVIFASSIQNDLPSGSNLESAIVFIGNDGTMYGNVTLTRNVAIPSGRNLFINNGQILTIQSGFTLTNNGTILVADSGNVTGTIAGNQPIQHSFTISGSLAYTYTGGVLTITGNGTYNVGMRSGITTTTAERIVIASGVIADITLSNVNINRSSTGNAAFDMTGATVYLTLVGDNVFRSGSSRAGLQAPSGSNLVIMGASTGTLSTTGGDSAAGIGGGSGSSGGNLSINGGTITATGGSRGIGGGWNGTGGTLNTINGNAVIFASSIQPDLPIGGNIGPAIVFNGNDGLMYGNVVLSRNITIPSGRNLFINNGLTLTIQSGFTLTNNGTIFIESGSYTGTISGNQPIEPSFTISGGAAYIYTEGVLTITGNGTYTIGMRAGVTSTTIERIVVASGVTANITLSNINIDRGSSNNIAFNMSGATVNLTLFGNNILRSGGGAGLQAPSGSTLTIMGASTGSLTATATWNSSSGAGIGGGGNTSGGNININGGTITATGTGSGNTSGIGGIINSINGNAVIFASSIQSELPTGGNIGPAIVFNGNDGSMYGNVTFSRNVTIPSGRNLFINAGQTLTIQSGSTLTNNGTILVANGGNVSGTVTGNQPVSLSFTISGGSAYTYTGGVLTITGNGIYTIGMRSGVTGTTVERIVVASGVTADIILSSVNINLSNTSNVCAFDMTGANVNLTLVGDNILRSGSGRAGLQSPAGSTLVIMGASTGSLTANGGNSAAGIGGGSGSSGGTISINGGTVTATGGSRGIGGGYNGTGGTINAINGNAVVFASSIQPDLPTGNNLGPAIVFIGNNGTMYGNVTLTRNITIPTDRVLTINNGQTLLILSSFTLTNNGTILLADNGNVSGTVLGNQPVSSNGLVIVQMWDSYGDGWDSGGALRIEINGTALSTNPRASGSGSNYYFNVSSGNIVNFYWISGSSQDENAFAVYYANDPPVPPFNPNSSSWSPANDPNGKVLLFRQYNTMGGVTGGTLLGSFTVP